MFQSGIPVKNVNPDLWGGGVCHANLEKFKVHFSRKTGEGGRGKAIRKISRLYRVFSIEGFPQQNTKEINLEQAWAELCQAQQTRTGPNIYLEYQSVKNYQLE